MDSSLPVIVDFHATWCGPCKLLGPKLENLVSQNEGKVVMAKVDIDEHGDLAMAFKVQAVPTVVGIKGGKVVDGFMGLKDDDQLKSFVDKIIGPWILRVGGDFKMQGMIGDLEIHLEVKYEAWERGCEI